jgi:hypothetical protein
MSSSSPFKFVDGEPESFVDDNFVDSHDDFVTQGWKGSTNLIEEEERINDISVDLVKRLMVVHQLNSIVPLSLVHTPHTVLRRAYLPFITLYPRAWHQPKYLVIANKNSDHQIQILINEDHETIENSYFDGTFACSSWI